MHNTFLFISSLRLTTSKHEKKADKKTGREIEEVFLWMPIFLPFRISIVACDVRAVYDFGHMWRCDKSQSPHPLMTLMLRIDLSLERSALDASFVRQMLLTSHWLRNSFLDAPQPRGVNWKANLEFYDYQLQGSIERCRILFKMCWDVACT